MSALIRIHADSDVELVVTVSGDNKPPHTIAMAPGGSEVGLPMATGDFITISEQAITASRTSVADPAPDPVPDVPTLTELFPKGS
jgi:hypothetical protein